MNSLNAEHHRKTLSSLQIIYEKYTPLCLIVILAAISLFVYRNVLFGDYYFIFGDIATDSFSQTYPTLSYIAESIHATGYPWWSFNMGLGQNLYASSFSFGDPFISTLLLSGKQNVPYMMGFMQMIKPIFAGLFFYLYLKKLSVSKNTAFIVAVMYAFCGHIIVRGAWLSYPNEAVWVAFCLFAIESLLRDHNWKWLPIAVCILFLSLKGYQSVLYTMILFLYAIVRCFSEFNRKEITKAIGKYVAFFIIGAALSAVIVLPSMFTGFDSPRISGAASSIASFSNTPFFELNSGKDIFSAFFRTISMDVLGTGSNYTGTMNYLESPLFYCGSFAVLLLPQSLFISNKKRRTGVIVFFIAALLYIFFPFIHYAFNGFATNYYKHSSFFITIIIAYAGALTLDDIIQNRRIHIPLLFASICATLLIFMAAAASSYGFVFQKDIVYMLATFIGAYSIILCLYKKQLFSKRIFLLFLAFTICAEALSFSNNSVNNRVLLTRQYINQESPFTGNTQTAVDWIKEHDASGFYRMEQVLDGGMLTKALYQDYYGTCAYSINPKPYINFLQEVNAGFIPMDSIAQTNYILPYIDRYKLNSLVGVKYLITPKTNLLLPGFQRIHSEAELEIWENQRALPFGSTYGTYVTNDDFSRLSDPEKDDMLLEAFVSQDKIAGLAQASVPSATDLFTRIPLNSDGFIYTGQVAGDPLSSASFSVNGEAAPSVYIPLSVRDADLRIHFTLTYEDPTGSGIFTFGKLYWAEQMDQFSEEHSKMFYEYAGTQTYDISLDNVTLNHLRFDPGSYKGNYTISDLEIYAAGSLETQAQYAQSTDERKENAMQIQSFSQNKITATVSLSQKEMLFLSMPFDPGWSATVDGSPAKLEKINIGFTGLLLEEGNHTVALTYTPPHLYAGIAVSLLGAGIYVFLLIRKKLKPRLKKNM